MTLRIAALVLIWLVHTPVARSGNLLKLAKAGACYSNAKLSTCSYVEKLNLGKNVSKKITHDVGNFTFSWSGKNSNKAGLTITDKTTKRIVFSTPKGLSFIKVGRGTPKYYEHRSSFIISDRVENYCSNQKINTFKKGDNSVELSGDFSPSCKVKFKLNFKVVDNRRIDFELTILNKEINRIYLTFEIFEDEKLYGFGTQYSVLNMSGKRVPILVTEQGIGRGAEPLTTGVELLGGAGVSGEWHTSYAPMPYFLSSLNRGMLIANDEYSIFDFKAKTSGRVELFSSHLKGHLYSGKNPFDIIEKHTEITGRFKPLPKWTDAGVVLGLQGGSKVVLDKIKKAYGQGMPISAVWIQDWVGKRKTTFGSQLWWDWKLDETSYSNWENFKSELKKMNIRILGYINPYLAEIPKKDMADRANLLLKAKKLGYLVKDKEGEKEYLILNSNFKFGVVDFSNPKARQWIKNIIKNTMLDRGFSGWMSDFAEGLPLEATLFSGEDAASWHNRYPVEWSKLTREVIDELKLENEILTFSRAGYTGSPRYAGMFWLGDQMVTWDRMDGLKTTILGQISSGLSGIAFNHSDIGGFTTITSTVRDYTRSKELFMRWAEANTFTSLLRTHEGNMPKMNHQFDSDQETFDHLKKFATIFKSLKTYRRKLMDEAVKLGFPITRHMFLHFPKDKNAHEAKYQFMYGSGFIVAPIVECGERKRRVYIPEGSWKHLFTNQQYKKGWHVVKSPVGTPPVFFNVNEKDAVKAALEITNSLKKIK
jgi:alpha-glucosidase